METSDQSNEFFSSLPSIVAEAIDVSTNYFAATAILR